MTRTLIAALLAGALAPGVAGQVAVPAEGKRPATLEEARTRLNALVVAGTHDLPSHRGFVEEDDGKLAKALANWRRVSPNDENALAQQQLVFEETAARSGTLCDGLEGEAAAVRQVRSQLETLVTKAKASVAAARAISAESCASPEDASRIDLQANALAQIDGSVSPLVKRHAEGIERLSSAHTMKSGFDILDAQLKMQLALLEEIWREHLPKAQNAVKQFQDEAAAAARELSLLKAVSAEFGLGERLREAETALNKASAGMGELLPTLTVTHSQTPAAIQDVQTRARSIRGVQAAMAKARRYFSCTPPESPQDVAVDAASIETAARDESRRLSKIATACRERTALPDRFGFSPTEITLAVGQTLSQPRIFGSFGGSPQSVDISHRVTFSGLTLPFTPLPEHAGARLSLTATLLGHTRTLIIHIKGDSPAEGTWDLTGTRTTNAITENMNATLTLVMAPASETVNLLSTIQDPLRTTCGNNGKPVMFRGTLVFARGNRFENVVACMNGYEVEGLFDIGSPTLGWFTISPREKSAKWNVGKKWTDWVDWVAHKRTR